MAVRENLRHGLAQALYDVAPVRDYDIAGDQPLTRTWESLTSRQQSIYLKAADVAINECFNAAAILAGVEMAQCANSWGGASSGSATLLGQVGVASRLQAAYNAIAEGREP